MSERAFARIKIGGKIKRSILNEIIEITGRDPKVLDATPDGDGDEGWTVLAKGRYVERAVLTFADPEATGGQFEELEAFLVAKEIPFDRYNDAGWEWPAGHAWWRPGMKHSAECNTTPDHEHYVLWDALNRAVATPNMSSVSKLVSSNAPPPPRPPFEIVDGPKRKRRRS